MPSTMVYVSFIPVVQLGSQQSLVHAYGSICADRDVAKRLLATIAGQRTSQLATFDASAVIVDDGDPCVVHERSSWEAMVVISPLRLCHPAGIQFERQRRHFGCRPYPVRVRFCVRLCDGSLTCWSSPGIHPWAQASAGREHAASSAVARRHLRLWR